MPGRLLLCFLFILGEPVALAQSQPFALTHVTVIDGTGAAARPNLTVVVLGGRIAALGPTGEVAIPGDASVIDATGKYLIPGLWDMHVHWYDKEYLPLFVANGVTGVRQMWGEPMHYQWRREIEAGRLIGPRMLIASRIVDGPTPVWPGSITARDAAEGRSVVARVKQEGADFIKVYSLLPREAYLGIAEEAKRQGISFAGHVPVSVPVEEASDLGQKSIEHLTGVLVSCSSREEELIAEATAELTNDIASGRHSLDPARTRERKRSTLATYNPEKAKALFARLKKNGTWQCPTLTVLHNLAFLNDPSLRADPRLKYIPRDVKASWDPKTYRFAQSDNPEDDELAKKQYQKQLAVVAEMRRAGVPLLAGTDVLNPYCLPGFSLHDELGLLVRAGLTPMEALQAATLNPARFSGQEKELGTVEKGKRADLVLLDANPLDDIGNTRKIASVVLDGRLFPRAALDQMLTRSEAMASKKSIAQELLKTLQSEGPAAAIKQYRTLKSTQPDGYDFSEKELNGLGYQLMGMKKLKEAIQIFELNAKMYPKSFNAYDSLGEAYASDGQKQKAIRSYQKSLAINKENTNAAEQLKKLK